MTVWVEYCPVCEGLMSVFTVELGPHPCPACDGEGVIPHCC